MSAYNASKAPGVALAVFFNANFIAFALEYLATLLPGFLILE